MKLKQFFYIQIVILFIINFTCPAQMRADGHSLPYCLRPLSAGERSRDFRVAVASSDKRVALLVEDEPVLTQMSAMFLGFMGYHVLHCSNENEAQRILKSYKGISIVVTDRGLRPGGVGNEGDQVVAAAKEYNLPVIMVTAQANDLSEKERIQLNNLGAKRIVSKPFLFEHLQNAINEAIQLHNGGTAATSAVALVGPYTGSQPGIQPQPVVTDPIIHTAPLSSI
jgi:CheY-like chemotaxis protein